MPKPGKETRKEHWTKLIRNMMEEPAWRALSPTAQALYPWLRLEWHGPDHNNNGKIRLSVRQAADRMGVGLDTVARAFHDLQAKGFIVMTEMARLGCSGAAKSPAYELTEIALPHGPKRDGRKLYKEWGEGKDFPVLKARANNPKGINGKTKSLHQNHDGGVIEIMTFQERASSK
ncbi:helix-turn-helix domain-containing protein [Shimia aestuarii]|uniref:helix-turn-helix domain-containing protein n=1 Tax=Shimia aestuarii TaxID=254406 RepID=UPI001FB2E869|nr:helix-turn-helix domain-containing protein [Shimia aestuarii]